MKPHAALLLTIALLVSGCLNRPVVYTGTQFGAHVQGVKNSVPEKLTVAYDRSEYAWLPRGAESSVKAGFDAEYRGLAGVAISDLLATGAAAGGSPDAVVETEPQSLVVSTTTKFNLGIDAGGGTDGAAPSANVGLKRSVFALFPATKGASDLTPAYADLSIHASGLTEKIAAPKGIDPARHLKADNGVRVVQTVATGTAATLLGNKGASADDASPLDKRLRAGMGLPGTETQPAAATGAANP
jgi:hypothetical protein